MRFWTKIKETWCQDWATRRHGGPPWQQIGAQRRSPSPAPTSITVISLADTDFFQPRESYALQRDSHGGSDSSSINRAAAGGGIRRATRAVRQVAQHYGQHGESVKSVPVIRKYDATSGNLLYLLPILVLIIVPFTFLVNYVIAASLEHASWSFPYISDFGNKPPESSIFGFMLTIAVVFIAATGYVRYKQIVDACAQLKCRRNVRVANQVAAGAGVCFCFGLLTVAHFQIISLQIVHYVGALVTFLSASVYAVLEAYVSHMIYPVVTGSAARILRVLLAFGVSLGFVLMFAFGLLARFNYAGDRESGIWRPISGGYNWRIFSVVMEWFSAICQLGYVATFVGEFKTIIAAPPSFFVHIDSDKVEQRLSAASAMAQELPSPDPNDDDDDGDGGQRPPETKARDLPKELIGYIEPAELLNSEGDPLDDSQRY